jgi:peptide chain release factor
MLYLQITTGRGPAECSLALHHLTQKLLAEGPGALLERASPQSSIIRLTGDGAEAYARSYAGTILWVCEDALSTNRKRKNWFLGVNVIELPDLETIVVREDDLKWEAMRASGPGGQAVNKGEAAVRLTHVPTGLTVISQDERSQKQNRRIALARLRQALNDKHRVQCALLERAIWMNHNNVERGQPVRTFTGQDFTEVDPPS